MTVPDGTKKHIRIGDAMAQRLAAAGAHLGVLLHRYDLAHDESYNQLQKFLSQLDDLREEVLLGEDLYEPEWKEST